MSGTDLAIVGGGASAVLLLAAIAKIPKAKGMRVDLYERSMAGLAKGIAYSTQNPAHLLNVRAGDMSAFRDGKDDFFNWVSERGFQKTDFVPRKIYAEYLGEKFEQAKSILTLNIVEADVTEIRKISNEEYKITYHNRSRSYKCVVQATGNVRPLRPVLEGDIKGYHDDPWSVDPSELAQCVEVALIGSGLTAMDTILSLYSKNFSGMITVYSRHALIPATHRDPASWPAFLSEADYQKNPYQFLRMIRQQVAKARGENMPWQSVIDSLRPHTNLIWEKMGRNERERFMKRLYTLWNVHRHRMAPQIAEAIKILEKAGRLKFVKSSVDKITPGPVIHGSSGALKADAVINCLGYRYKEEGRNFSPTIKIGPPRFGDEFETTAIPEIRNQAALIAAEILKNY